VAALPYREVMAKHEIEVSLPAHEVRNTDVTVIVHSNGQRLGELAISKGSIDWRPARKHAPVRLRWERFADLMERYADGEFR
jgi:hypothetical protein